MDVAAEVVLADVLDDLAEGRAGEAVARLTAGADPGAGPSAVPGAVLGVDPAVVLALAAVASFWRGDFAAATAWAGRAVAEQPTDPATRALACAAASFAAAGDLALDADRLWAEGAALLADGDGSRGWAAVRYLLAESALVTARLLDARTVLAGAPAPATAWAGAPIAAMMWACEARLAAFSGDITRAEELLVPLRGAVVEGSRLGLVVEAVAALVLGNADDAPAVRTLVELAKVPPADGERDFVDRGVLLLLAFGVLALGDVIGAATLVFRAGDDGDLTSSTIIDRALGFEMFLGAALDEEDLAAADTWLAALNALEGNRIAAPVVRRGRARHLLAAGEAVAAVGLLEDSLAQCRAEGRVVEVAEGEIVLALARIELADVASASRNLRALVIASDASGHRAVRRAAALALQPTRRRLPPVAGGRWEVLSEREAEVARCILDGLDVGEIAATLFLSEATVRSHVSRVLAAFGVPTRIGLLAVAGRPSDEGVPVAALSPRQTQVAELVAAGRSNQQIADELAISVKGVEKHVGDVLSRWSARSRFDIARIWLRARGTPDVEDAGAAGVAVVPTTSATPPPTVVPASTGDRSMDDGGRPPR